VDHFPFDHFCMALRSIFLISGMPRHTRRYGLTSAFSRYLFIFLFWYRGLLSYTVMSFSRRSTPPRELQNLYMQVKKRMGNGYDETNGYERQFMILILFSFISFFGFIILYTGVYHTMARAWDTKRSSQISVAIAQNRNLLQTLYINK